MKHVSTNDKFTHHRNWHILKAVFFCSKPSSRLPFFEDLQQWLDLAWLAFTVSLSCLMVAIHGYSLHVFVHFHSRQLVSYLYKYNNKLSSLPVILINHTNNLNRMTERSSRSRFNGEEVLTLLDKEEDGMDDNFFPGSDEDLALNSDAGDDEEDSPAGEDEEGSPAGGDEEDSDAEENVHSLDLSYSF